MTLCLPAIKHFVTCMISFTMIMSLLGIRLELQVKVLSIDFSPLEEKKLSQPDSDMMVDR